MFTRKGARILQKLDLIPKELQGEKELAEFLSRFNVKHPSCGRIIKAAIIVEKKGSKEKKYLYARLKHSNLKTGDVDYCYERLEEDTVAEINAL